MSRERVRCQRFGAAAIICLSLAWLALPAKAQSIQPIHSFTSFDGALPVAGLTLAPDGNFYGTTQEGGSAGHGTVFRITPNGAITSLASFLGANGEDPDAGLTLGPDGNFYGTTAYGGSSIWGTAFRVTTNGTLTTLVSFTNTNGGFPESRLMLASDGNFYGTTVIGGDSNSAGTVFRITTNGALTTLAIFDRTNGEFPGTLALAPD